jgi:PRC-barrel domain
VEVFTLERQARTEKFTEEVAHRFASYTVYDQDYEKIGNVDDLFIDESDHPEYIGVKMGFLGTRTTLIPVQMARVNDARRLIEVAADKQTLKNGPTFDDDREITPKFENEVYSYYGLQWPSTIEHSGTYAAHSAEQSTQKTTGRIKEAGGTKDNVTDELDEAAGRGRRGRDDRKEGAPEEVGQPGSGGVKANVRDEWAESQERR